MDTAGLQHIPINILLFWGRKFMNRLLPLCMDPKGASDSYYADWNPP